MITAAEFSIF